MKNYCAQSDATFSDVTVIATLWCFLRKSTQIPPNYVVKILNIWPLQSCINPESARQAPSAKQSLRVNNTCIRFSPNWEWIGDYILFPSTLYILNEHFYSEYMVLDSAFFMCPLVRSGNHR